MNAAQRQIADQVAVIEKAYRQAAATGTVDEVLSARLGRAATLQRQLLEMNHNLGPAENTRLEWLEGERDTWHAQRILGRIAPLEQTAEAAQQAGDTAAAVADLRAALQLQQEINRSAAAARDKDFVRETRLTLKLEAAEAAPLREQADAAVALAVDAAKREDWPEVLANKIKGRDLLVRLNQNYPNSRFADIRLQAVLDVEITSLEAAGAVAEIVAREKGGDAAAAAGRAAMAAELYQAARNAQTAVNTKYAGSRFVATRRVEELEIKRQTVLAGELWQQAVALDRAAGELLGKRQVLNAAAKVAETTAILEKVEKEFPKSRTIDGTLRIKLAYLGLREADLRSLQDECYALLLPVPGEKNLMMLRTELPQALYTRVMNANPSRNAGSALPVDSVDWNGAQDFCQRLSWLLGVTVRLPTEKEFRAALGSGEQAAWTAESSGGQSRETGRLAANGNGFYDLLGNLAEWLQNAGVAPEALVAGGSYLDASEVLRAAPAVTVAKTARARHIGFRVVVELALE